MQPHQCQKPLVTLRHLRISSATKPASTFLIESWLATSFTSILAKSESVAFCITDDFMNHFITDLFSLDKALAKNGIITLSVWYVVKNGSNNFAIDEKQASFQ